MFIVLLKYMKPISEVNAYLEEHVTFLNKYYNQQKFIMSGRKVPRTGGVIVVQNTNREEIEAIIKEDPFNKNEIATYEIIEFEPTKYDDRLQSLFS